MSHSSARTPGVVALCVPPVVFGMLALAEIVWLRGAPAVPPRDLLLPIIVATEWHGAGLAIFALAAIAIVITARLYARAITAAFAREDAAIRMRVLLCSAAITLLAIMLCPVLFSSDLYAYAAYGHMAALGVNPYTRIHIDGHDPLFLVAIEQWNNPMPVCVYGPLFVFIARAAIGAAALGGVFWQLTALRLIACVALLACGPLAYQAFAPLGRRAQHIATIGIVLNPVALWSAAEGHNDALMLAFVLAGFIIVRKYSLAAGSSVITLSMLVKASALGATAALAIFHFRNARRLTQVLTGSAFALAIFGLTMLPYAAAFHDLLNITSRGVHYTPEFSLQYLFALACTQLLGDHSKGYQLGVAIALTGAGLIALYGLNRLRNGDTSGAAYFAFGLWLALPNAYPWYALWILPTAFLSTHSRMFWVIITASLTIFARYLLDISMESNTDLGVIVTLIAIGIPCLMLLRGAPKFAAAPLEREAA